jgi:hypothetical protein
MTEKHRRKSNSERWPVYTGDIMRDHPNHPRKDDWSPLSSHIERISHINIAQESNGKSYNRTFQELFGSKAEKIASRFTQRTSIFGSTNSVIRALARQRKTVQNTYG